MNSNFDTEFYNKVKNDHNQCFIYPEEKTLCEDCPFVIYVPNNTMMLKIMRACIGIQNEKDLWFNN